MISAYVFGGAMAGIGGGSFYIRHRQKKEIQAATKDQYYLFRERLGHYARMKSACATTYHPPQDNTRFVATAYLLDQGQHEILLGILKKVESKSAAVAVVAVLAFDLVVGNISGATNDVSRISIGAVAGLLVVALMFSLEAASHLGQPHYRRMLTRHKSPISEIRGRELQRDLIHDALKKEARLRAFFWLTTIVIGLLGIFFLAELPIFLQSVSRGR